MANAGELVIKIAADYAELSTAMSQVNSKLDGFGNNVAAMNARMGQAFGVLRGAVAGMAAAFSVDAVLAYGKSIEQTVGNMADMADNLKMSVDEFQAFQSAAYLAGQSTEAVSTAVGKFNVFIGKAAEGSKEQVEALNELGVKILDVNGKLRPQADLLTEAARKVTGIEDSARRAAVEVALFGKSGQAVSAILEQWAKGTEQLNKELEAQGLRHTPEVVKQLDELADRSDKAAKKLEVFFAPIWAAAKAAVMDAVATSIDRIAKAINAIDLRAITGWERVGKILLDLATFNVIGAGAGIGSLLTATGAGDAVLADIKKLDDAITKTRENIDKLKTSSGSVTGTTLEIEEQRLAKYTADRERAAERWKTITGGYGPNAPAPAPGGGTSNPGVKGAGDSILDEIKKLEDAERIANNAMTRLSTRRDKFFDDVQKNADQQKRIDEKVSDLMQKAEKAGVASQVDERIMRQVRATIEAQDALKEYAENAKAAEQATRSLGDGTEEYTIALEKLAKMEATGRLSEPARLRYMEQVTDKLATQREEVARARGGWASFTAGFDRAGRQFRKAHDEFSMGEGVFSAMTTSMSEGLDVLMGKSSKTFGQIAADFAAMLAKMALEAALSQVFKMVFGAAVGSAGGGGGQMFGPPAPAASGVSAGGNRAIGGMVDPGQWYNVGEYGPERFVPHTAGRIEPATGGAPNITINNNAPAVDVSAERQPNGDLRVTIEKVRRALSRDVQRGGNVFAHALESAYRVQRGAV